MTVNLLKFMVSEGLLKEHHTARCIGYVSRKSQGIVEPYKGRFGKGYKLLTPAYDSTYYCFVTYYIERR